MVTIHRVHANFKRAKNKLDSNHKKDLPVALIDDIADASLRYYVEFVYNNFESIQKKTDMLRPIVKPATLTSSNTSIEGKFNKISFDIPQDYAHYLRGSFLGDCNNFVNIDIIQLDDLDVILQNPYLRPSKEYNRAIGIFDQNQLHIYTEELLPDSINIHYVKEPRKVFYGGYDTLEFIKGDTNAPDKNTAPIHPEIPDLYLDLLIEIMVKESSGDLGDTNQYNLRKDKISQIL